MEDPWQSLRRHRGKLLNTALHHLKLIMLYASRPSMNLISWLYS